MRARDRAEGGGLLCDAATGAAARAADVCWLNTGGGGAAAADASKIRQSFAVVTSASPVASHLTQSLLNLHQHLVL